MFTSKFFDLGQVVVTRAINEAMKENNRLALEISLALKRFCVMDWGNTSEESKIMNDKAVLNNDDRIFAVYDTCKGKIWIITEWDRSATTVLFPSDY